VTEDAIDGVRSLLEAPSPAALTADDILRRISL